MENQSNTAIREPADVAGQSAVPSVPDPVLALAPDWLLGNIAEGIKNTQQVFFLLLSLLTYCGITVIASSDRQIALNSTVQLPLLNSSVSFQGFMILSPAVALLVYIYLHLYILKVRSLARQARLRFAPIESGRFYPWVLPVVEPPDSGSVGLLQTLLTNVSLWWMLPLILLFFPLLSVKKHSIPLTTFVGIYPYLATALTYYFWRRFHARGVSRHKIHGIRAFVLVIAVCNSLILFYLAPYASAGKFMPITETSSHMRALRMLTEPLRRATTLDLSYQVLITELKPEYDTFWVDLEGARLEGANLKHSILKLANLRNAHLEGAECLNATFRTAMLDGADFRDADLQGADLSYAKLLGAQNLSVKQACKARTLYAAKMDDPLAHAVASACPYVLSEQSQNW